MEASTATRKRADGRQTDGTPASIEGSRLRRLSTETKQAFKTTEFWAFVGVVAMILISAAAIKGGTDDEFIARQAWLFVAIVTGSYLIGRGLAKSGVRDPYTEDSDRR